MLRPRSSKSRVTTWPRDWITWAACCTGIVIVVVYVALLLITGRDILILFFGAAVGFAIAPALGARRSTFAGVATAIVFLLSVVHPAWLLFLYDVVRGVSRFVFPGSVRRVPEDWVLFAVTASGYSILLGFATLSWRVALAILACGVASILVDYAFSPSTLLPGAVVLCLGVVIIPAIDTLARAGRTFNPHACPRCNYDLSGLHSPTCPECGNTIPTWPPLSGPAT